MKIGELSKRTGITAPTIRFYEQIGLLDARHVRRRDNQYRDYSEEAVEQIQIIKEVQAAGFTLAEFRELDAICRAGEQVAERASRYLHEKIVVIGVKIGELERVQRYLLTQLDNLNTR